MINLSDRKNGKSLFVRQIPTIIYEHSDTKYSTTAPIADLVSIMFIIRFLFMMRINGSLSRFELFKSV